MPLKAPTECSVENRKVQEPQTNADTGCCARRPDGSSSNSLDFRRILMIHHCCPLVSRPEQMAILAER